MEKKLDEACERLRQAMKNHMGITKEAIVAEKWRAMALQSAQKKIKRI